MAKKYVSCSFIEKGLVFSPHGLYFCCLPIHGTSGWPLIAPFSGGNLPIKEIKKKREELRRKLDRGEFTSCYGCDYWLSSFESKADESYLFNTLVDNHHTLCNLHCSYCCWLKNHVPDYGKNNYSFLPILKFLLDQEFMDPQGVIAWGGGEPALLPEFNDCLTYARSFPLLKNDIYSNATIFSEPIYEALKDPSNSLMSSVDAGTSGTYMAMKHHDLLYRVWDNLETYGQTGGRLMIKYIVTDANNSNKEFEAFVREAEKRNLLKFSFGVDMSFESSVVNEGIVKGIAFLANMLEDAGASVIAGVHGNHTLPRQMVLSRVSQWREIFRLRDKISSLECSTPK